MKRIDILIFIFVILGFGFSIYLLQQQVSVLVQKKAEAFDVDTQVSNIPVLTDSLNQKKEAIDTIEGVFPHKEDLALILAYVEKLSIAHSVSAVVHFESADLLTDGDGNTIVPASITIEGKYENIRTFLNALRFGKYLFGMSQIDSDVPNGLDGKNILIIKGNFYAAN